MIKSITIGLLTIVLIFFLDHPLTIKNNIVPPIGKFFNPYHGFWKNAEGKIKRNTNEKIQKLALTDNVNIYFDDRMVPHIATENESDAVFAQGFVTASMRLFQMDLVARATEGRLSELLGKRTISYDRQRRNLGLGWAAENAVNAWKKDPQAYKIAEAYVNGVNAYINSLKPREYPIEFKILNYKPEPWSIYKMALVTKSMAVSLCMPEKDLENSNTVRVFGMAFFNKYYPDYNPHTNPVIPEEVSWDFEPLALDSAVSDPTIGLYHPFLDQVDDIYQLGSNNWAISANKSKSGNPILSNDPHLGLTLPSVWFENHIITNEYSAYGVSIPGVPFIILGFNEDIAWGSTNVGQDVLDWYLVEWGDSLKTTYMLDDQPNPVSFRKEEIKVKGGETIIDTIRYTIWGPVFESGAHHDMAMRWIAHDEPPVSDMQMFAEFNRAKSYDDYRKALKSYYAPAQNLAFASKTGDIAITVNGAFPLRRPGQGKFVQDGSKLSNSWAGFIPFEHNPYVHNPTTDFVASANQRSTDTTYPYYYIGEPYFEDYRGRILNRELSNLEKGDREDMKRLQNNNYTLMAEDVLPAFLEAIAPLTKSSVEENIYQALKNWDREYTANASAPVFFDELYRAFYRNTWDEIFSRSDSLRLRYPENWVTIDLLVNNPTDSMFDIENTPNIENAQNIIEMAFRGIDDSLKNARYTIDKVIWGKYSTTHIRHIGQIPGFGVSLTNTNGQGDALNAIGPTSGPSWRMIVELGETVEAEIVKPGGQSGNPGSYYYETGIEEWVKGDYFKVLFTREESQLKANALKILHLNP